MEDVCIESRSDVATSAAAATNRTTLGKPRSISSEGTHGEDERW